MFYYAQRLFTTPYEAGIVRYIALYEQFVWNSFTTNMVIALRKDDPFSLRERAISARRYDISYRLIHVRLNYGLLLSYKWVTPGNADIFGEIIRSPNTLSPPLSAIHSNRLQSFSSPSPSNLKNTTPRRPNSCAISTFACMASKSLTVT
jgi:hypothetical protein